MKLRIKITAATILFSALLMPVQAQSELPLHLKRLSKRAIVAWTGDYYPTNSVVALTTSKGIVVIEAGFVRANAARIRQAIEKEFGRKDCTYLINTHYHHDHTAANQVFADTAIIGHKNVPAGMKEELTGEGLTKLVDRFKQRIKDWTEGIKHEEQGSRRYHYGREGLALAKMVIKELQEGFTPTYPAILFEKNLILDMGDMTLELYSFGGMHTDSDIVIFIPEEKLVVFGDLPLLDFTLPYLRKEKKWNLDEILENWGRIVNRGQEIKHVNVAQTNMTLSVAGFKEQYKYFKTLRDGLQALYKKGLSIEEAKKAYTIEKDFPYFKDKRLEIRGQSIHEYNIEAIWERLQKK